jgi:hypothetical protein
MSNSSILSSSFRDPSGFLFYQDGSVYRQVNLAYKENYDHLMTSGLHEDLVNNGLLVRHNEVSIEPVQPEISYKIIKPLLVTFISYPYEWCFSQLKNAALTTLEIQKKALEYNMSLKDASAYNIQFLDGKAVLIDTLSFEKYIEGRPWIAYRQFCQHFLAPLALMVHKDIRLNKLLSVYLDGIPLNLAGTLLPAKTLLSFPLLSHIHLHAKSQKHFGNKKINLKTKRMSQYSFKALIDNLEVAVKGLKWEPRGTQWADYYEDTNYSSEALEHKKQIVNEILEIIHPENVLDLGANNGVFSRMASCKGIFTISTDFDPAAVEKNYQECIKKGEKNLLPLTVDITNPSPPIGWRNKERLSFLERISVDTIFALALIHHFAISNNLPLYKIAEFFKDICKFLVIEFVPKNDSQVQRLLANREDIFHDYNQEEFELVFFKYFKVLSLFKVKDSERIVYLLKNTFLS